MIKNIIFDWTGVIKDCRNSHSWVVNKMFTFLGIKGISIPELRENWEEPYMFFWKKYIPNLTIEREQELYKKFATSPDCPKSGAYKNIVELIKKLKKERISICVLSGDLKEMVLPEIEKFGLGNIFEEFITNAHDKKGVIDELIKRNNFNPEETIFIGDSNHEVEAGKEAGVKTIAVTWGLSTEDKLKSANPDFIIHNLKELEEIILKK